MDYKNLTLRQKIAQMFILGFNGTFYNLNRNFVDLLKNGLGGVIFFTHNINSEKQFKELISSLSKDALVPLLYSIDQEGGRVERTEKIHNGKKYLSAKQAYQMGHSYLINQTKEIALELKNYGINMNFAPVLDVNTNDSNPIIGERAFANNPADVINASKAVVKEYEKYNIITVGKHFPGHGETSVDSHKGLPVVELNEKFMREVHIKPFKEAIKLNLPAIMVAHVLYPCFDNEFPASISKKIISEVLIKDCNFDGVVVSDDMEMNGIKGFSKFDACINAINAGVNMFIYRDTTKEVFDLISKIEKAVNDGIISKDLIDTSFEKIISLKCRYRIVK